MIQKESESALINGSTPIPTLSSIRNAWSGLAQESSVKQNDTILEIEEYLRIALFRASAIAYKLEHYTDGIEPTHLHCLGAELQRALEVCEQVSLFGLLQIRSLRK